MKNNFEDEICPACGIIDRFGDKWSLRVLVLLSQNTVLRFNEILRKTPGISQKMLTTALKKLEEDGLIKRKMYPEIPPKVEYRLTSLGASLIPALEVVIGWALDNSSEILRNREKQKNKKKG